MGSGPANRVQPGWLGLQLGVLWDVEDPLFLQVQETPPPRHLLQNSGSLPERAADALGGITPQEVLKSKLLERRAFGEAPIRAPRSAGTFQFILSSSGSQALPTYAGNEEEFFGVEASRPADRALLRWSRFGVTATEGPQKTGVDVRRRRRKEPGGHGLSLKGLAS
ncbi:Hypothetical predicted protein [Podarcis lilfordi]|uniref:Uncharacterized protein n=1 Tax=Podarcis lilfordi TaxID=74358 RepID=A0AA35LME9_9SAUR|nr:Hypothetical predicted protein [Podarcis lilfordi]